MFAKARCSLDLGSFFGRQEHVGRLPEIADPLAVLDATVDCECFYGWLIDELGCGVGTRDGWPGL